MTTRRRFMALGAGRWALAWAPQSRFLPLHKSGLPDSCVSHESRWTADMRSDPNIV